MKHFIGRLFLWAWFVILAIMDWGRKTPANDMGVLVHNTAFQMMHQIGDNNGELEFKFTFLGDMARTYKATFLVKEIYDPLSDTKQDE